MTSGDDASKIREMGWRQGSLVMAKDHAHFQEHLRGTSLPEGGRIVIVSQDCDLVHDSYADEPIMEIVIATFVLDQPDGNFTHSKNPRRVHIPVDDEEKIWLHCDAADRFFAPRRILENISPDEEIAVTGDALVILARWLANRYKRTALPDEFNERLRPKLKQCRNLLKKHAIDLVGLYLNLSDWHELDEDITYKMELYGVLKKDCYQDTSKLSGMQSTMERIEELIESCAGLEVSESRVLSEEDFSLFDLRRYRAWNLDAISLKEGDSAPLPPP